MRGLIWNCRGIGDKKDLIKDQIDKHNLDSMGIQETMKNEFSSLQLSTLSAQEDFD